MAKKAAPPELTGGKGPEYEDHVAAWFLLQMLAGRQPLGPEYGTITSVHFQTKESGWLLDDLLVVLSERGQEHFFAISIKRRRQVTRNGFPENFVRAIWEQWLRVPSECFERGRDLLGLVTGQMADSVEGAWHALLQEAIPTAPERLVKRLHTPGQTSALERSLFASLQCSSDLQMSNGTDEAAAAELLRHVRLLHLDFRAEPSTDKASAISLCQEVLHSGDSSKAAELWQALIGIASGLRAGGSARLPDVIRRLCVKFRLRDFPDYKHDWRQLGRVSDEAMAIVRGEIGGRVLSRGRDVGQIRTGMEKARVFAALGESGCGKSAIAKELAHDPMVSQRCVWLNGEILDHPDLLSLERRLGLNNHVVDVMKAVAAPRAMLIFDAVDRFSPQALALTARLLGSLGLDDETSPWHVLMTCQPENWQSVLGQMTGHGVPSRCFGQYVVESPKMQEIDSFLRGLGEHRLPTLSVDLRPVLRNLKVLDWVVSAARSDPLVDARRWVGVSDVAEWLWEIWLSAGPNRYPRAEALKRLGEKEGETLASGVSLRELTDSDRGVLPELETSGLVRVSDERVHFTHDLLGDWARMRVLLGEQGGLPDLLRRRASSPRWHRAIRLYGQRLLEKGGDDARQWRQVVAALQGDSHDDVLVRDLFLEAIIFAVNADHLLDLVWPELSADGGRLLVRLLKHFLHAATLPDPRLPVLVEDDRDIGPLSSIMRVPYWPYWRPMLCFLDRHRDNLAVEHHHPVSQVCSLWLEMTPPELQPGTPWPWRQEAARVALHMAREVQVVKALGKYFLDETDRKVYEAFLRAAPDLPEDVTQLALECCRRRQEPDQIRGRIKALEERRKEEIQELLKKLPERPEVPTPPLSLGPVEGPMREPWPDGPRGRVDDTFRKVCLETSALTGLMATRPEVARETLLAVCIEEPRPDNPFDYSDLMRDHLGTEYCPQMCPPMFFRGSFLQFLRLRPEDGLNVVLRLVNFATDRWLESQQKWAAHQGEEFAPSLLRVSVPLGDRNAEWVGDQRVYGWFRNLVISANLVASALMAVEKWLYEELDAGRDISQWLGLILGQSRSVAFAGLLAEIAKKEHSLLAGPLMSLLGIWQIYSWDHYILANSNVWGIEMMSWSRHGERIFNLVRDWHTMPHRKQSLQQLAVYYLLKDEGVRRFFEEARKRWAAELATEPNNETLELLIARFDPANYKASKGEDGKIYIGLEWPEHLRDRTEADLRRSELGMEVLTFPYKCRRLLDGEETLEREALPAFWDQLRKIDAMDASQDPDLPRSRIEDAVCGGIAVLLVKHGGWLTSDPDKAGWCVDRLASVLSPPPERAPFAIPETITTTDWSCFAAESGVALLAQHPDSKPIRQLVAGGVAAYFHASTALTMRMGYQFRQEIGDDFARMQNVAVLWAALSLLMRRAEVLQVDRTRLLVWYGRLIDAFIRKSISASPLPWDRVEAISCRLLKRMEDRHRAKVWGADISEYGGSTESSQTTSSAGTSPTVPRPPCRRRRPVRFPGFDTGVLQSAFAWLPALREARDAAERQVWVATWHEMLAVTLRMVEADEADDVTEELSGTPYQYDCWVFGAVARLIPQMELAESPERFWKPIVDLGPAAHYWVEDFLQDWVLYGPDAAGSPEAFVALWRPMIEHCLASHAWSAQARAGFRLAKMYVEMMGLGLGSERIGREEFAAAIGSMADVYERWAATWLKDGHVMRSFAPFLTKPGAKALVCRAIHWIREAVAEYDEYSWSGLRPGEMESLIADVLWTCWSQHRADVQRDRALRNAFLELMTILANRLCPSAMELRDEVLRSLAR